MTLAAMIFAAALVGQGSDQSAPAASAEPEVEMVCRREQATGSNRLKKVCRPKVEVEAEKAERARNARLTPSLSSSDRGPFQGSPRPPPGRPID